MLGAIHIQVVKLVIYSLLSSTQIISHA